MRKILLFVALLITLSVACNLPQRIQSTSSPETTPSVSLEEQLSSALQELATTGQVTLTITEEQLSSFIREQSTTSESNLRDLQVDFQDNQIRLTGTTSTGIMDAQVEVVFEPSVAEGTLQMQIVSAKVGSLPLPERTVNVLSQTVNDRIGQLTTFQGKPLKIEEVRVEDELLSITGSLK
jgi:uncharacterized protein YpmS